jgi:hypothetical protein
MRNQRIKNNIDLHVAPRRLRQFSGSASQEETPGGRLAPTPTREIVVDHESQHKGHIRLIRLRAPGDFFADADAFAQAAFQFRH